jgi:hypothetical protein
MTYALPINPFYSARNRRPSFESVPSAPVYAKLPRAPINASPVPRLTSLYHNDEAGSYGDRRYPGNCSGELIKDLLLYFRPEKVLDPMTGGGTCRDVCDELGIPCDSTDLHEGHDAGSAVSYPTMADYPFIWIHPPYGRQKICTNDPRDLSQAKTLDEFLERYARVTRNCADDLAPGGKLAILMGDYNDHEWGFTPPRLPYQALGLRGRTHAALHRHHPLQPRGEQFPQSLPLLVHPRLARCLHHL